MTAQLADVQALVKSGFGSLGGARYLLLRIADAARARQWLAALAVTDAGRASGGGLEQVLQVAFTAAGLRALGIGGTDLAAFAPEFVQGMAGNERRSHRLGDTGPSAPRHWRWGMGDREPHVLLIALARQRTIADWSRALLAQATAGGCRVIDTLASCPAREDGGVSREPFGFIDGMSQPEIDWTGSLPRAAAADRDYRPGIALGEVLLGHVNEYGFVADHPQRAGLGHNGSYLVYRQLEQDVTGFWQWLAAAAGRDRATWLAERMVGRQVEGRPLDGLSRGDGGAGGNAFLFKDDPDGLRCPLGSHIRRANPRSGDDPLGRRGALRDLIASLGLEGAARADAVASARFHRLIRRGRPYGAMLSPEQAMHPDTPGIDAGLHFLCLNASLARQFEFVQGAWLASATFGGLAGEQDPLLGGRTPFPDERRTDLFRYRDEAGEPRIAAGLPRFVTTRGGGYFFLPGLNGLRVIAAS